MDVKEKLMELLRKPIFRHELADPVEAAADYLIANGVTVQAAPTITYADLVPHGRWEWYISPVCLSGDVYHRCSICGESDPWQMTTRGCANFCPNCGAKMDVK